MLKNKIFKGIIKIEFWIGVNSIPEIHTHQLAQYKPSKTQYREKH